MDQRETPIPEPPRRGVRGALSLLRRNHDFRNLYIAQLISFAGDWFLIVSLYDLVLDLTDSAVMTSLVLVSQLVPFFLMSPVAGSLVDRVDRQRLMVAADVARAVLCLGFLLVGPGTVWLVFVLQASLAIFSALFEPASSAAVPNLVEPEDLPTANTLVGSAWGTMLAVGAAVGGLVAALLGRETAFVADAISFAFSAFLLVRIRGKFSEAREVEHPGMVEATVETLRYARADHRVLALLAVKGGFGVAGGVLVLLPVFATEVFEQGAIGIGLLYGVRGVGALIGPFLGARRARGSLGGLFMAIGISMASFGVFYGVFPFMPTIPLAAIFCAGAHLGSGAQWMLSTYGLQVMVPDHIRGRVFAFDFALVTLSITLSNLAAGWSAERFGPRPTMFGLAGVAMAYAAVWWVATRRVRAQAGGETLIGPPADPDR
jgi:MFS family permease